MVHAPVNFLFHALLTPAFALLMSSAAVDHMCMPCCLSMVLPWGTSSNTVIPLEPFQAGMQRGCCCAELLLSCFFFICMEAAVRSYLQARQYGGMLIMQQLQLAHEEASCPYSP